MKDKLTFKIIEQGWTEVYSNTGIHIGDLVREYSPALNSGAVGYVKGGYVWNFLGTGKHDKNDYHHHLTLALCGKVCHESTKKEAKAKLLEATKDFDRKVRRGIQAQLEAGVHIDKVDVVKVYKGI